MTLQTLQNFYKTTVATAWGTGTGNRYVTTLPTPSAGRLVINPSNTSKREIISYTATGTDGGGNYITVSARGVGGTTDQTHAVGEAVRMNLTAQHYADIQTDLDLKLDDTQLDTDGTLAANSDSKIATQKATKTYADTIQTNVNTKVSLTGNETVAGVKTFSSSPIVPTPTASTEAVNKSYADGLAIAGSPDSSTSVKGIGRVSVAPVSPTTPIFVGDNDPRVPTQAENDALVGSGTPSSSNKYVTQDTLTASIKFGGTGADGALTISSGTTTLNVGSVAVYTKNYTSVSITSTAKLLFTTPHTNGTIVSIYSQGGFTATSSTVPCIDVSGMGASAGNKGQSNFGVDSNFGLSGADPSGSPAAVGGAQATVGINLLRSVLLSCGAGGGRGGATSGGTTGSGGGGGGASVKTAGATGSGGNGSGSANTNGDAGGGGIGGGALYIECAGAYNFTGTMSASGLVGSNGATGGGGGGGGGGGSIVVRYGSLTANSGTYTVTGGAGGSGGANSGGSGGAGGTGGAGYSSVALNSEFL